MENTGKSTLGNSDKDTDKESGKNGGNNETKNNGSKTSDINPKAAKYGIYILFMTLTIDMMGIGIIFPVLPQLLQLIGNIDISEAAKIGGLMMAAFSFMQFFMSPIIGNISDSFGRRKVIMFSTLAYSIDWLIMALSPTILILFIGRMLSGSFAAIYATSMAYISDIIEPEKRAGYFGLIGAGFGIGFTIGPLVGGLLGEMGPRIPFFVAAILSFINFFIIYFFFPESLPKNKRRKFEIKRANPISSILNVKQYKNVLICLVVYVLFQSAHNSIPAVWSYFTVSKFNWSPVNIGISLTFVGIAASIVQGGLVKTFIKLMGAKNSVLFGVTLFAFSLISYAFISVSWLIYVVIFISALAGVTTPALQAIMTKDIPSNQQGELQGAVASLMSLTMLSSALWATQTFKIFSDNQGIYLPGFPFLIGSVLLFIALFFAFKIKSEK